MIDFYYAPTPNTWKVAIMLEECGLDYRLVAVDLAKGGQFAHEFLAISPNNKVPAIVDLDAGSGSQAVFESGAILVYLAEKTGRFLAVKGAARIATLEWLFWQVGGLGPMAGQAGYFRRYAPEQAFAIERYTKETGRLLSVLDRRLADHEWLAGEEYSIADMACWGWIWFHPAHGQSFADMPNVERWFRQMSARPAVQRAKVLGIDMMPEEARAMFDGDIYQLDVTYAAASTKPADKPR